MFDTEPDYFTELWISWKSIFLWFVQAAVWSESQHGAAPTDCSHGIKAVQMSILSSEGRKKG